MPEREMDSSAPSGAYFLELKNIDKYFGAFKALDNVSMCVETGEFVSVLGPSGCGKTTLLRVVAGLEIQNGGSVWIGGRNVSREPVASRGLGIVFQSYALFPNISVIGNVEYGLRNLSAPARRARALEMLDLVGLADQPSKFPAQLSGGQQQRVALARALAPNPSLLLLDEPLSALDARVRVRLRGEIRNIQHKLGVTTIMVTHDQEEALTMADRIVVMDRGRLMQYSAPRELYAAPANPFVAGFIGVMNFLPNCRCTGGGTVRFLDYELDMQGSRALAQAVNGEVLLAIRPEHVRTAESADQAGNRIRTRIRQVEFRGSVSRAQLQILYSEGTPSSHYLEMDMHPKAVDQLQQADGELTVNLAVRHLLAYPPQTDANGNPEGKHAA